MILLDGIKPVPNITCNFAKDTIGRNGQFLPIKIMIFGKPIRRSACPGTLASNCKVPG